MGGELPTFTWVMLEIIVHTLVEEVFFYYTHRYIILCCLFTNVYADCFAVFVSLV